MPSLDPSVVDINWLIAIGLGCLWLGAQIVWVAPLPRQFRRLLGETDIPQAAKGSPTAFSLFWIDQYGWIGLVLCALGLVLALTGALL